MTTLPRDFLRSGRNAFVTATGPKVFTSNTLFTVWTLIHSMFPTVAMPALFTTAHSAR
jgi:hypothetical protein